MSRPSFRPRPLDIHKKLPIVKSIKEFEDDDVPTATATRNSQLQRIAAEAEIEVHQTAAKRSAQEIPIPQFIVVDSYETDYSRTFNQPSSYLRARAARSELGEFVEYDLDNEDDAWLDGFNNERKILSPEKFEAILFKLEVLDHKTRERAGVIAATYGGPVPVLLQPDSAFEALQQSQPQSLKYGIFQSVYSYWKKKRERWQKPVLRRLQPPPPVNDTNPYNVFRPREKVHRLHTRRMQRRENNVQSFEKLRQVRRNLDQVKTVFSAIIKREEKKREVLECEVKLQQFQMRHKHEAQLVEDGLALHGFSAISCKFGSSEDDPMDSDDGTFFRPNYRGRPTTSRNQSFPESRPAIPAGRTERPKREPTTSGSVQMAGPVGPRMLFTLPLDLEKLAAAGIMQPCNPPIESGSTTPPYRINGRMGRGGRIIFDRWKPLLQAPLGHDISSYKPPNLGP